jgi:hypothetical protein
MNLLFYFIICLGWSNIIVDFLSYMNVLMFKPFSCKPCFSAWLGILVSLIVYPLGSIECLVLPALCYLVNKILENYIV